LVAHATPTHGWRGGRHRRLEGDRPRGHGIRVNTVSPGPVLTPWWTKDGGAGDIIAAQAGTDRETVPATVAPQAMHLTTGRPADPREVADVIALLVSPRSGSTTGAGYAVDCGFVKAI
jgi:NAD(P)-dependent dehydrogenase (short-subunit alcohol dehydrogenase family)